jgi:mono/diheme cytochrome c family protein
MGKRAAAILLVAVYAACSNGEAPAPHRDRSVEPPASSPPLTVAAAPARPLRRAAAHEGGAVARSVDDEVVYVADEDHGAVRVVRPPSSGALAVATPGPPAQVLALDGLVLVTVRDPGLLVFYRPDAAKGLVELRSVPLPPDAWGIAVTPDERTALVTSPWADQVSAVDLEAARVAWSIPVAREPRGVVVLPGGATAYVTHLVGADLTRVDRIGGAEPGALRVPLPPAPASAPYQGHPDAFALDASLAYAAVLSPAGDRLFVPRHALGAYGRFSWFGRPVVDVLRLPEEKPVLGARTHAGLIVDAEPYAKPDRLSSDGQVPLVVEHAFTQPRAAVYRRATRTLLVAGEGDDRLVELDARSLDPGLRALRVHDLGGRRVIAFPPISERVQRPPDRPGATKCGAPSGIALSRDEKTAFVWCRSTGDLAIVDLDGDAAPALVHLADDALGELASLGRRLFYDASDPEMSGGLACAACHPEGRADGHVWHLSEETGLNAGPTQDRYFTTSRPGQRVGVARRTPMLVSRVAAERPYGWRGESRSLEQRIEIGFAVHRWGGNAGWFTTFGAHITRAKALVAFLREGLVAPPLERRERSEGERRGEAVFSSSTCGTCHAKESGFTDRSLVALKHLPPPAPFQDEDPKAKFKTPSLLFAGKAGRYYHDGHATTLAELIDDNHDRMGLTDGLSREDRAALAAYVATIGTVSGEPAPAEPALPAKLEPRGPLEEAPPPQAPADDSPLARDPPSPVRSPKPTAEEWKNAPLVALPRASELCRVTRVREWLRVECATRPCAIAHAYYNFFPDQPVAQVTLIAGSKEDVDLSLGDLRRYVDRSHGYEGKPPHAKGILVFPVRRGDARLLEVDQLVDGHKSYLLYDGAVDVSESWPEGAAAPEVVVTSEPCPKSAAR